MESLATFKEPDNGGDRLHEHEWALRNAIVIEQEMRKRGTSTLSERDESMADNAAWLADRFAGERIVIWAHNGHVTREEGRMGHFLEQAMPGAYRAIALAAGSGDYTAFLNEVQAGNPLQAPPADSLEHVLGALDAPALMLDLRAIGDQEPGAIWRTPATRFRSIGWSIEVEQFTKHSPAAVFDAVIYIDETSSARQLPSTPMPARR